MRMYSVSPQAHTRVYSLKDQQRRVSYNQIERQYYQRCLYSPLYRLFAVLTRAIDEAVTNKADAE
jgi:hypothetical protein